MDVDLERNLQSLVLEVHHSPSVVLISGLGHFAILFGKAMGAEVTAISHSPNKEQDAKKVYFVFCNC
jgi:D-arabinose 1-dehydrogenase-like Zn-dependent alcohol dehydrogenase